jgi:hypothetical protein
MSLPQGQRGGRSPLDQYYFGMAQLGTRGLDSLDTFYAENPGQHDIVWQQMDDNALAEQLLQHRDDLNDALRLHAPPPRWSRVTVDPPQHDYLNENQCQDVLNYVEMRVPGNPLDMASKVQVWQHALWYFNQLLHM